MSKDRRVLLGHIAGAQGLRGEVLIKSYADVPEDIAAYGPLENADGKRRFEIEIVRETTKGLVARVAGVSDRTAAEGLKGEKLFVARAALPPAEAGAFYHHDLIGLAAVDPSGAAIGKVVGVHDFGAGPLIEIALGGGPKTELLPFTDAFVPTVDIGAGRVTVVLPVMIEEADDTP